MAQEEQRDAARNALWRRFEDKVDPERLLGLDRRRELARHALNAHMASMRLARSRQSDAAS
jgi:hypothetical protein